MALGRRGIQLACNGRQTKVKVHIVQPLVDQNIQTIQSFNATGAKRSRFHIQPVSSTYAAGHDNPIDTSSFNIGVAPAMLINQLPSPTQQAGLPHFRTAFAEFYYKRHFESGPLDPASFIDQVMTDYAHYDGDVVGDWLINMSPLYKLYKACIKYVVDHGPPQRKNEAQQHQRARSGGDKADI